MGLLLFCLYLLMTLFGYWYAVCPTVTHTDRIYSYLTFSVYLHISSSGESLLLKYQVRMLFFHSNTIILIVFLSIIPRLKMLLLHKIVRMVHQQQEKLFA